MTPGTVELIDEKRYALDAWAPKIDFLSTQTRTRCGLMRLKSRRPPSAMNEVDSLFVSSLPARDPYSGQCPRGCAERAGPDLRELP